MKKFNILFVLAAFVTLVGCGGGAALKDTPLVEVSLADQGIPVTVMAPEGAEVSKGLLSGEMDGITLYSLDVNKDDYKVNVSMWDEPAEESVADNIARTKADSQEEDGFASFVKEEANGYIYKVDDDGETYNFYYVMQKDGKNIIFTSGAIFSSVSQEDAEAMYNAVKQAK